jgi:hypothetical protein
MSVNVQAAMRNGFSPAVMLSIAVCALALPSAVLAFTSSFDGRPESLEAHSNIASFAPATVDPRFARTIAMHNLVKGQLFRFTPAGTATRPDRSVTVAVRVDPQSAQAIQHGGDPQLAAAGSGLRLAPSAYSLGVSRGYQSFTLPGELHKNESADLAAFHLPTSGSDEPSRLNARIAFDEREKTGRAPRTLEGKGEPVVDVGGSFSVTNNLNVTAGVRYSQERDRLLPQSDGQKDNQAVYVGTQFRF